MCLIWDGSRIQAVGQNHQTSLITLDSPLILFSSSISIFKLFLYFIRPFFHIPFLIFGIQSIPEWTATVGQTKSKKE